jgi:hypothetical protein
VNSHNIRMTYLDVYYETPGESWAFIFTVGCVGRRNRVMDSSLKGDFRHPDSFQMR